MQQVFIWSQLADSFSGNYAPFPVIGDNSNPISTAISSRMSFSRDLPAKDHATNRATVYIGLLVKRSARLILSAAIFV